MPDPKLSPHLQFLKLGGSLITDKNRPHQARPETLKRLGEEIASALRQQPEMRLLLGHGSGSFGHIPAHKFGTRQGVYTQDEWRGFVEVWQEAAALNRLVFEALSEARVPALAFPPSAMVTARDGQISTWHLEPLRAALQAGLLPVVYGDVVFDTARGGTILSTEDLFTYLARQLSPQRVLLAGIEPGVWADYPACTRLLREITPANLPQLTATLGGSRATDVTGGMQSKVHAMLALIQEIPGLEALIFSGDKPGAVEAVLLGAKRGTRLRLG